MYRPAHVAGGSRHRRTRPRVCGPRHRGWRRGHHEQPDRAPSHRGVWRRPAGQPRRPARRGVAHAGGRDRRTDGQCGEAGLGARGRRAARCRGERARPAGRRADGQRDRWRQRSVPGSARCSPGPAPGRRRRNRAGVPRDPHDVDACGWSRSRPDRPHRRATQHRRAATGRRPVG